MATITKTVATSLLSLQSVASNTVVISSAQDVSTKLAATVFVHFGRRAATALTQGVDIRVEGSSKSSGEGHWYPLAIIKTDFVACEAEAVSGTVNAGQKVITVAATANLTVGDIIFIDNGTIANSEWHRIKAVSTNTSVTVEDDLVNAQTGATLYDRAEMYALSIDLTAVSRLRLVFAAIDTGQAVAVEAHMTTADSIG